MYIFEAKFGLKGTYSVNYALKSKTDRCHSTLIVGFHMTSLKFKLKNHPSYRDFTFKMH